jgi:hypothetical protein
MPEQFPHAQVQTRNPYNDKHLALPLGFRPFQARRLHYGWVPALCSIGGREGLAHYLYQCKELVGTNTIDKDDRQTIQRLHVSKRKITTGIH